MKFLKILPALIMCLTFSSCATMGKKDACCATKAEYCCPMAKKKGTACCAPEGKACPHPCTASCKKP